MLLKCFYEIFFRFEMLASTDIAKFGNPRFIRVYGNDAFGKTLIFRNSELNIL